jgi:hypothetical protein
MHLTEASFKKAAKRLADDFSIQLADGQERLAKAFNFSNFNAALNALSQTQQPAQAPVVRDQRIWLGIELGYKAAWLLMRQIATLHASDNPDNSCWLDRGLQLLDAGLADAFVVTQSAEGVTVRELRKAMRLDVMVEKFDAYVLRHGADFEDWPRAPRLLGRYLSRLPAARLLRRPRPTIDSMAYEQHDYRLMQLDLALDFMEMLEGSPSLIPNVNHWAFHSHDKMYLREMLAEYHAQATA